MFVRYQKITLILSFKSFSANKDNSEIPDKNHELKSLFSYIVNQFQLFIFFILHI